MSNVIAITLLVCIPLSFLALVYLYHLWLGDGRSSAMMKRVIMPVSTMLWLAGTYFCAVAAIRLEKGLAAVPEWTVWVTTTFGVILLSLVVYKALYFRSGR